MTKIFLFLLIFFIYVGNIYAQHTEHHSVSPKNKVKELTFKGVLEAQLSDDILKNYSMQSSLMTVPAGFVDSVAHRHDADLFGYVINGKIVVALEGEGAKTYTPGQMFHETKNILHTRLENLNSNATAEVLLIFIIRKGASSYIKE
jgi:quercetin dioxygenase-like cupin family protein